MTSDPRAPHIRELIEDTDTSADIGLVIELAARWGMAVDAVLRECDRLDGLVTVDDGTITPHDTGKETDR